MLQFSNEMKCVNSNECTRIGKSYKFNVTDPSPVFLPGTLKFFKFSYLRYSVSDGTTHNLRQKCNHFESF